MKIGGVNQPWRNRHESQPQSINHNPISHRKFTKVFSKHLMIFTIFKNNDACIPLAICGNYSIFIGTQIWKVTVLRNIIYYSLYCGT